MHNCNPELVTSAICNHFLDLHGAFCVQSDTHGTLWYSRNRDTDHSNREKVTSWIKTVLYRQSQWENFRKRTTRCTELHAIARTCANLHILAGQCTNLHDMARRCTNLLVTARHCTSLHTYRFLINRPGSLGQRPSRAFSATQRQVILVPEYSGYSVLALALTVARHLQI
jgi:hypothetical protein